MVVMWHISSDLRWRRFVWFPYQEQCRYETSHNTRCDETQSWSCVICGLLCFCMIFLQRSLCERCCWKACVWWVTETHQFLFCAAFIYLFKRESERRRRRDERREVTEKGFIQIRLREEKVSFPDGQPPWSFYTLTKLTKKIPQHITWAYTVFYDFDVEDSIAELQDHLHARKFYLQVHQVQKVQGKCYVQRGGDEAPGKSRGRHAQSKQSTHTWRQALSPTLATREWHWEESRKSVDRETLVNTKYKETLHLTCCGLTFTNA